MKKIASFVLFAIILGFFWGCASSIVDGEYVRTSSSLLTPKENDAVVDIYFSDKKPERPTAEIGRVSARAWVLEKGINELKLQARQIGADAIINITYERKLSVDYLQDLYFLNGEAVIWE